MKNSLFISLLVCAVCATCCTPLGRRVEKAQSFLDALQERDSVLVLDQFRYGFELPAVPQGIRLGVPEIPQPGENLVGTVRVLSPWQVDTVRVLREEKDAPARYDLRAWFLLTPMDEGEYQLPALSVRREGVNAGTDTLFFDPQVLSVKTMPVDTATFVPHDIKDQVRYPLTAAEAGLAVWISFFAAALITTLVCLVLLRRRRGENAARPGEPAHITALRLLDRYRGSQFWAPDKQKQFYSGVTDALRGYMAARYGIGAMEMTTAEIFDALKATDLPGALSRELQGLFERADFVKFAKYTASDEENAAVLPLAVRFVTETYRTEVENEAEQPQT